MTNKKPETPKLEELNVDDLDQVAGGFGSWSETVSTLKSERRPGDGKKGVDTGASVRGSGDGAKRHEDGFVSKTDYGYGL